MNDLTGHLVTVVGAGPAGIFGARKLAEAGCHVLLLNRDVRPGGLAEYGIYFNKYKMKEGLRKQFHKILTSPRVHYLGHLRIGQHGDLTLRELRDLLQPSAIVVAAGAQGTKYLGIPNERAPGVYHAKDLVYYYNGLPPFSLQEFLIGERVAIIGIGNVMVDVAHYLVHVRRVKEVIAVARRGPAERAYYDSEIKHVAANIHPADVREELARIRTRLTAVGQDPDAIYGELVRHHEVAPEEGASRTRLSFRFLSAPKEIVTGPDGRPAALRVEDTELLRKGESMAAKGLGTTFDVAADTVVFAVGDRVDEDLGLAFDGTGYIKNPHPDPEHPGDERYQVYDSAEKAVVPGKFVVGWSRAASEGLVGQAKMDSERGIQAVLHYLQRLPAPVPDADPLLQIQEFRVLLAARGVRTVDYHDIELLRRREEKEAARCGLPIFRYTSDRLMFDVIEEEKKP
jgi:ferredoxin--NADP+ reductase